MSAETKKPRVTIADLELAALWLDCNEGDDGEADACHRVAAWLEAEISQRLERRAARQISRETGAPMSAARLALTAARDGRAER